MLTEVTSRNGMGFGFSGSGNTFRYRHNGGNEGFRCFAVAFAGTGRGMVIMTNSDAGTPLLSEVAREYGWDLP